MRRVAVQSLSSRRVVSLPARRQSSRSGRAQPLRVVAYVDPRFEPELRHKVHAWFENIVRDEQPIDHLLAHDAILTDHLNEACYKGAAAIKHRLSEFHKEHMSCNIVELGAVSDLSHNKVCAHWACSPNPDSTCCDTPLFGSNIFVFNDDGLISQIVIAENPTFSTIKNPKWQQATNCGSE